MLVALGIGGLQFGYLLAEGVDFVGGPFKDEGGLGQTLGLGALGVDAAVSRNIQALGGAAHAIPAFRRY